MLLGWAAINPFLPVTRVCNGATHLRQLFLAPPIEGGFSHLPLSGDLRNTAVLRNERIDVAVLVNDFFGTKAFLEELSRLGPASNGRAISMT
jgi:hypothetical protein